MLFFKKRIAASNTVFRFRVLMFIADILKEWNYLYGYSDMFKQWHTYEWHNISKYHIITLTVKCRTFWMTAYSQIKCNPSRPLS